MKQKSPQLSRAFYLVWFSIYSNALKPVTSKPVMSK
jgi:hypothetical protein